MIEAKALLDMKSRMLLAAEAANLIVNSQDETVRFDEEQYWRVRHALASLHSDVTSVMAEIDILRGMFVDRVNAFITGGLQNESGLRDSGSDSGNDVHGVAAPGNGESGGEVRTEPPEASSPVPAKGPTRRRGKRPVSRRHKASDKGDSEQLDIGAGEGEVGREPDTVG